MDPIRDGQPVYHSLSGGSEAVAQGNMGEFFFAAWRHQVHVQNQVSTYGEGCCSGSTDKGRARKILQLKAVAEWLVPLWGQLSVQEGRNNLSQTPALTQFLNRLALLVTIANRKRPEPAQIPTDGRRLPNSLEKLIVPETRTMENLVQHWILSTNTPVRQALIRSITRDFTNLRNEFAGTIWVWMVAQAQVCMVPLTRLLSLRDVGTALWKPVAGALAAWGYVRVTLKLQSIRQNVGYRGPELSAVFKDEDADHASPKHAVASTQALAELLALGRQR
jgi:hypothetical protein